jgi:hypothetical protein
VLLDILRNRVKPTRDAVRDASSRSRWWQFARPRGELREATLGRPRYIATVETAIRRYFVFLPSSVAPDHMLIAVASDDAFLLGVLSSSAHVSWALAAGARLGIDATPRYSKGPCFEAYPFPDPASQVRERIASVAERIDQHRHEALRRDERVTLTAIYHVLDKLGSGDALTSKEREIHKMAACSTLRDLHDELDHLVAEAYGWPWPLSREDILERLVALHDQRVAEEAAGHVRWLRPDYQIPRLGADLATADAPIAAAPAAAVAATGATAPLPWPTDAVGQITAVRALAAAAPISPSDAATRFAGARLDLVQRHLETLAMLGEVRDLGDGRFAVAAGVGY